MINHDSERSRTKIEIVELQIKQLRENFNALSMEFRRLSCKVGNFFDEHRNCGNFTNKDESYDE